MNTSAHTWRSPHVYLQLENQAVEWQGVKNQVETFLRTGLLESPKLMERFLGI